jgi:ribosomal protein L11
MKREQIKKTSIVFFAIVTVTALFAVNLIISSQQAAAVHHKTHTTSSQVSSTVVVDHEANTASKGKISVHQVAVIPEVHGKILNATELKKLVKGPYGESDVIGGMMSGGY